MKTLNETFNQDEFEKLVDVKGERSWREAILEEFGVE
jgi:hypothetical protein